MTRARRTRLIAAVPAALLSLSLVGCGDIVENAAEDAIEDAAKSEGVDIDIDDLEDGNISVGTTDGEVVTGELPQDYPVDEVPVVDGEILLGNYTKSAQTWNVTVEVGPAGGDKQAAYDEAAALLTGAGAETTSEAVDNDVAITGVYTTASYTVNLASTDSNGIVINYTVSPK